MISTKAAVSIAARLERELGPAGLTPAGVLAAPEEKLRGAGLSRSKALALLDLAGRVQSGLLPLDELPRLPDEEVVALLTPVRGIGVWTAEMFLIFCLGRLDVLPVGDLGLRAGVMATYGLPEMPKAVALARARRGVAAVPHRGDVVLLEEPGVRAAVGVSRTSPKRERGISFNPSLALRAGKKASSAGGESRVDLATQGVGTLVPDGLEDLFLLAVLADARLSGSMARQYSRKAPGRSRPGAAARPSAVLFVEFRPVRRPAVVFGPLLQHRHGPRQAIDQRRLDPAGGPAVNARRRGRLLFVRLLLLFLAVMQPESDQAGDDGDRRQQEDEQRPRHDC